MSKKAGSAPIIKVTDAELAKVTLWGSFGMSLDNIAESLNYASWNSLSRHKNADKIKSAYITGQNELYTSNLVSTNRRAMDDGRKDCTANSHFIINKLDKQLEKRIAVVDDTVGSVEVKISLTQDELDERWKNVLPS